MTDKYNKVLLDLYDYALMGSLNLNSTEEDKKHWGEKRNEYRTEILELINKVIIGGD